MQLDTTQMQPTTLIVWGVVVIVSGLVSFFVGRTVHEAMLEKSGVISYVIRIYFWWNWKIGGIVSAIGGVFIVLYGIIGLWKPELLPAGS